MCQCNAGYTLGIDETACFGMTSQLESGMAKYCIFFLIDINECSEETDDCAQNCANTNGSYTCSCIPGFVLDTDRRNCSGKAVKIRRIILLLWYNFHAADILECSDGTHSCTQICNNTVGSYHCQCFEGYQLNEDGFNCTGEPLSLVPINE